MKDKKNDRKGFEPKKKTDEFPAKGNRGKVYPSKNSDRSDAPKKYGTRDDNKSYGSSRGGSSSYSDRNGNRNSDRNTDRSDAPKKYGTRDDNKSYGSSRGGSSSYSDRNSNRNSDRNTDRSDAPKKYGIRDDNKSYGSSRGGSSSYSDRNSNRNSDRNTDRSDAPKKYGTRDDNKSYGSSRGGSSSYSDRNSNRNSDRNTDRSDAPKKYGTRDDNKSYGSSRGGSSSYSDRNGNRNSDRNTDRTAPSQNYRNREDSNSKDWKPRSDANANEDSTYFSKDIDENKNSYGYRDTKNKGRSTNYVKGNNTRKDGDGEHENRMRGRKKIYQDPSETKEMPLNKYLAHCGITSRREAVEHIKDGKVKVNGELEINPAYKVRLSDQVTYKDQPIKPVKDRIYILLNKPKGYITTVKDEHGRKNIVDLVKSVTDERVYPIGRLDRNTTGLILLTNDGDLTQKLSHPKHEIKKIYQVSLNKPLTEEDKLKIEKGFELDDGPVKVDELAYTDPKDKREIGIEIHSGRNRIVRRIFEHFGYEVIHLDRVIFANLSKKNLPRGKFRFLNAKEIVSLKHLNKS